MSDPSAPKREKTSRNRSLMICFYRTEEIGDQIDNVELSDYFSKMKKLFRYRDIPRCEDLEEEKLKKTEWCESFKAKIAPQVCMLRRQYDTAGYCNKCEGTQKAPHSE